MKVEVAVLPGLSPVPNKPTVSVDVKQHSNNDVRQHLRDIKQKESLFVCLVFCFSLVGPCVIPKFFNLGPTELLAVARV